MEISKVRQILSENVCVVTFKKVSGEERVIKGTTIVDYIPSDLLSLNTETKQHNGVVRIFDLESNGWRSFRLENLIELEVV